eukprot:s348_g5.t1
MEALKIERNHLSKKICLPDARRDPFSGVRYSREESEEESEDGDDLMEENNGLPVEQPDREEVPPPPRICLHNGTHGAAEGGHEDVPSEHDETPGPSGHSGGAASTSKIPTTDEGIEAMTTALAEIMEGAEAHSHAHAHGHGGENVESEEDDEDWIKKKKPQARYRRYVQSGMEEVSDPDEWAEIHIIWTWKLISIQVTFQRN